MTSTAFGWYPVCARIPTSSKILAAKVVHPLGRATEAIAVCSAVPALLKPEADHLTTLILISFQQCSEMASPLLQRLSLFAAFLFTVHLPASRQQIRSTATTLEDMKSLFGASDSEFKLTTTLAESVFDRTTQDLTAEFRILVSASDAWRLKTMHDQTCPGSGMKVFNFSRRTLSEVLDISRDLFPVVLLPPSSTSDPPGMTTVKNPSAPIISEKLPPTSTSSQRPSNSSLPSPSSQHPVNSSQPPPLSTQSPANSSQTLPPSSQRSSNFTQPPSNSSEPPSPSSQHPVNSSQPPPLSTQHPLNSSQPPSNASEPPPLSTQPPANSSYPPRTSSEPLPPTTAPQASKGRRKRGASALETQFVEHKIRVKRATSGDTSENAGSRFLQFVCCPSQANMTVLLGSLDQEAKKKMVSPSLLAMLTNETLSALKSALPDTDILCNGLLEADVQDLITITKVFACSEQVQKLAQSSSVVAAAVLDQFRARISNLSADEWKMLISNFSSSLPQDLLDKAPEKVIMDNFQILYSREMASVLLQKVNLTAVDASFLIKLGNKLCELPRSALDKIPAKVLQSAVEALACVGTSEDASLKSLVAKVFNTSDVTSCKTFLTTVDPLLERCWDLLSGKDIQSINFTSLEKFGKLPIQLTRKLRDKMNLTDPKTWTEGILKLYPWLLGTLLPDQLASLKPELLKNITTLSSLAQVDMPASVQRQVYATQMKTMDKAPANLTSSDLRGMRNLLPAMSPSDAKSLSSEAVGSLVGELAADVQKMAKTTRETILNKLTPEQLQEKLCQMGNLSEDVSAQQLEKGGAVSLGNILLNASHCQYKCQQQAQCYAVYSSMMKAIVARGYGLSNITKDQLASLRDTRAICGIPLGDVKELPASATIESWQAAFLDASCENLKAAQAIAEKYRLVLTYVTKTGITKTNVAQLGPQAIVNTDLTELRALDTDGKKTVVQLMGRQPLYDASADWNKQMLGYAYDAYLSGNASAEINSTTALAFGYLLCSLNSTSYKQLTSSAILDAAPILGKCPELSQSDLLTLQQVMVSKTNKSCSNMDADDVAIRGTILFADCSTQSCLDQIPPRSLYEAVSKLVDALTDLEKSVDMRERQWNALSDANKQALSDSCTCGMLKALDGRARYRAQSASSASATRRKRSTASQQVTCEDIMILKTKSNVLTVQQINGLNTTDFDNCAETLGTATGWSLEQKAALIGKAKQTWGQQSSNWTKELIQRMGSIAQGLSESEITSLAYLDLDVLSTLGQYTGWTLDQLKSGFSSWLKKDTSNNISAINGSHLQQMGDFACGATSQQISSIPTSAFKDALNKIGTLYSCSAEQLDAWAALGLQALGQVTEWTYAQSAAADVLYAGLSGSSLSLLSSTQLTMISLNVFVRIKPSAFSALTVSQMASLSTAQALSVTADQLNVLNPAQKAQLKALGATISDPGGAPGVSVTASTLVATWTAVWLIMAY